MENDFDKRLIARISELFSEIEGRGADFGWQKLREKYPVERERKPFLWLWLAAAALVILGIGFWLSDKNTANIKLAVKPVKHLSTPGAASIPAGNSPLVINKPAQQAQKIKKPGGLPAARYGTYNTAVNTNRVNKNKAIIPLYNGTPANHPAVNLTSNVIDSVKRKKDLVQAVIKTKTSLFPAAKAPLLKTEPTDSLKIDAMFKADNKHSDLHQEEKKPVPKAKKVTFDVYATTYFNYAKGSSNQFNAGAGFSANLAITKGLSLVTGLSVAQNSLSFNGQSSVTAQSAFANYGILTSPGQPGSSSPAVTNYNANLVGLDIPFNFRLSLIGEASASLYFLAGFSSGTFISEAYSYQYNYQSSSSTLTGQSQTSNRGAGNFYFAKTLNAAFGFGYPVGKNQLIIEPFLKYPLSGLGAEQLKFGAGGINLKFNIQSSKK